MHKFTCQNCDQAKFVCVFVGGGGGGGGRGGGVGAETRLLLKGPRT